ncbi:MAG: hypothetical protein OER95_08080, partial [Acidimicrobiia bacterium]|nr:hypothetical protein [Acidimicrobiia bacterium]
MRRLVNELLVDRKRLVLVILAALAAVAFGLQNPASADVTIYPDPDLTDGGLGAGQDLNASGIEYTDTGMTVEAYYADISGNKPVCFDFSTDDDVYVDSSLCFYPDSGETYLVTCPDSTGLEGCGNSDPNTMTTLLNEVYCATELVDESVTTIDPDSTSDTGGGAVDGGEDLKVSCTFPYSLIGATDGFPTVLNVCTVQAASGSGLATSQHKDCALRPQGTAFLTLAKVVADGDAAADEFVLIAQDAVSGNNEIEAAGVVDPDTRVATTARIELLPGDYVIDETNNSGVDYEIESIICNEVALDLVDPTLALVPGNDVTCTITNKLANGTLTLVKAVDNTGGGEDSGDEWTLTASDDTGTVLSGMSGSPGATGSVAPGTYSLSETAADTVTGDYVASWSCVDGDVTVSQTASVDVAAGDDITCTVTNTYAALTVDKSVTSAPADTNGYVAGETISYKITVSNPTNADLTGVTVSDPKLTDLDCTWPGTEGELAAGQSVTCTGSYLVTQDDVDGVSVDGADGDIDNTATADSGQTDEATGSAQTPLYVNPSIAVTKTGAETAIEGDAIEFTISVINDGTVTLDDVAVGDSFADACVKSWTDVQGLLNGDDVAVGDTLTPGETFSYTCSATATEVADKTADDGTFTNTATVNATAGDTPVDDKDTATVDILTPLLTLSKTAAVTDADGEAKDPVDTVTEAGDLVVYTITATNDGDTALDGVMVSDPKVDLTCTWPDVDNVGHLEPTESVKCTGTYIVDQTDLDNDGDIGNTATATSNLATAKPASASVPVQRNGSVDIAKYYAIDDDGVEDDTQVVVSGATATWTIVINNDGNLTLTGIEVTDPNTVCNNPWPTTLDPGTSFSNQCSTAGVTADFRNTATVTAKEDPTGDSDNSDVTVIDPELTVTKSGPDYVEVTGDDDSVDVVFTIKVENTGDVDLKNLSLTDDGAVIDCDPEDGNQDLPTTLAVDDSVTCTATVTATVNDDGTWSEVPNKATVTGTADAEVDGGDPSVKGEDDATVGLAGVTVSKQVVALDEMGDPVGDPV